MEPVLIAGGRGLNNRKPVLSEDRNDRIPYRRQIRIPTTEVWVRLVHHHVLAFRLCLRE